MEYNFHDLVQTCFNSNALIMELPQCYDTLSNMGLIRTKLKLGGDWSKNSYIDSTKDHLFNTTKFRFLFRFENRQRWQIKTLSGIFNIHVLQMIALIWHQIWKLDGELYKMKPIRPRWYHQWRHSVTSNIEYSCLSVRGPGSKFKGQYLGNEC